MTKDEAIKAMQDGKKVSHRHFDSNEWMKQDGVGYVFEDGCHCAPRDFWHWRDDDSWIDGWRIVS